MSNKKKRTHNTAEEMVGMQLENGATILKASTDGTVLCLWGSEFVTWHMDHNGDTHQGHYHKQDLEAAIRDFETR